MSYSPRKKICLVLLSEFKRLWIFFYFNHPIIQSSLSKALPFYLISAMKVAQVLLVSNRKHVSSWPYLFTPPDLFHFLHKNRPQIGTLDSKMPLLITRTFLITTYHSDLRLFMFYVFLIIFSKIKSLRTSMVLLKDKSKLWIHSSFIWSFRRGISLKSCEHRLKYNLICICLENYSSDSKC